MTDDMPTVRWRRKGAKGEYGTRRYTRYHVPVSIAADRTGQTACGIRYPRRDAEYGKAGDGELCRNCVKAVRTVPESLAA